MNCMMKRFFITAIVLFLVTSLVKAQEEFIEPPSKLLTRMSFTQLTGGVVIIRATLEDFPDTLNFILAFVKDPLHRTNWLCPR